MKYILLILPVLMYIPSAFSLQNTENIHIELQAKKVVFLESEEKIFSITIQNISSDAVTMEIAENIMNNIKVEAYDDLKLPVSFSTQFHSLNIQRSNNVKINSIYQNTIIESDDTYSFDIILDEYLDFKSTGVFTIFIRFFPTPFSNQTLQVVSQPLLISVLKDSTVFQNTVNETNDMLVDMDKNNDMFLYPEDTINYALHHAQKANWNKFMKAIDIRSVYLNIQQKTHQFMSLDYQQQRKELIRFIQSLQKQDNFIFLTEINTFSIAEIRSTKTKAMITTILVKRYKDRKESRKYIFFLDRMAKDWKISNIDFSLLDIEVINISRNDSILDTNLDYLIPAEQP